MDAGARAADAGDGVDAGAPGTDAATAPTDASAAIDVGPPADPPLQLFLDPAGDDASDGLTRDTALLTLERAHAIHGCYFDRIGNVFNRSLPPSTAAVRLVNSDDNEIANNHFADVVNTTSAGLIHSLYVAHMSDRNRIERNLAAAHLRTSGNVQTPTPCSMP